MDKNTDVKQLVQEHYGEVARRASGGGSAATCCTPTEIYTPLKISGLPDTVLAASAGCGDPTALAELKSGEVVLDLGSGGGVDCFLAGRAVGPEGLVLGVDMTQDMVKLAIDFENTSRAWWENGGQDLWESIAEGFDNNDVLLEESIAKSWIDAAAQIEGWEGGPPHSPHPICLKSVDEDEEL